MLELALTRIFSVVFYYHFAFLAISIALFGLGAGGVFSYVVARWPQSLFAKLGAMAAANGILVLIALVFLLTRQGELNNLSLAAVYFTAALPFFFAGAIISLAISETISRVDRVYFYDLMGAAGGGLLVLPFLNMFGGPNTLITVAVIFAASAAVWFNLARQVRGRAIAVILALALTTLFVVNLRWPLIDVRYAKGQTLGKEKFVKWNGQSRISVVGDEGAGGNLIVIDADASTGVPGFDLSQLTDKQRRDLLWQGPGLPYQLRPSAKTLIIGPGGGWDVARALAGGSRDVTGVEINPIIANTVMRERFAHLSNRLYHRPDVHIHVMDGRSWVRQSSDRFQVLQLTLVDTWASTAAGAFALSENNLYTSDAFYDYLSHLTPDGFLAFTRWGFDPPRESLRLLTLADTALAKLDPRRRLRDHVIIVREGSTQGWGAKDTVLISREPFTPQDIERTRTLAREAGFETVYLPGDSPRNPFGEYLTTNDQAAFLERYQYDVRSLDDNRPFFFYTVQPRDLWAFLTQTAKESADYKINRAVPLLFGLMIVSLIAVAVILILPPLVLKISLPKEGGTQLFLLYFLSIGIGYILVQVTLIQKFVLFLGHPTYALTVVIFSMLIASGLGSFFSRRLKIDPIVAALIIGATSFALAPVLSHVEWPWELKVAATIALIAPAAFCMGMPFPQGLRWLEERSSSAVRWAWSINAAASVLGSASAIFLSIYLGIQNTLLVAVGCYLAAGFLLRLSELRAAK